MKQKDFDSIVREVTEGLTGIRETDFSLVFERLGKYRNRSDWNELLKAAIEAIYRNLSDEEFGRIVNKPRTEVDKFIDDIERAVGLKSASRYEEALSICEHLSKKIDKSALYQDDETKVYRSLQHPFEVMIEVELCGVNQEFYPINEPYFLLYMVYGSILIDLDRPEEARAVYKKGLRWSPVNVNLLMGYAVSFIATRDWEKAREILLDVLRFAYDRNSIAECYRGLGDCYGGMDDGSLAAACYFTAFRVDDDVWLLREYLSNLKESLGQDYSKMSDAQIGAKLKEAGIPDGPNMEIVDLARGGASEAAREGKWDLVRRLYRIVYGLAPDEKLLNILNMLDKKLGPDDDDFEDEPPRAKRPLSPAQRAKKNKKRRKK